MEEYKLALVLSAFILNAIGLFLIIYKSLYNFDHFQRKMITALLNITIHQNQKIMKSLEEFKALQDRQNEAIKNVAADIRSLKDKLLNGGLTAAEEAEVFNDMEAKTVALEALAGETPEDPAPTAEG